MDDLVALGAPGPPARQEGDVPVEALPADRAGGRLDLQRLGFDTLLYSAPSHRATQYRQAYPFLQAVGARHAAPLSLLPPLSLPGKSAGLILQRPDRRPYMEAGNPYIRQRAPLSLDVSSDLYRL